jgi:hypothetical protein
LVGESQPLGRVCSRDLRARVRHAPRAPREIALERHERDFGDAAYKRERAALSHPFGFQKVVATIRAGRGDV